MKVVDSLEEAEDHIAKYGSGHSECIITENYAAAQRFLHEVDAAAVYVNASTRLFLVRRHPGKLFPDGVFSAKYWSKNPYIQ